MARRSRFAVVSALGFHDYHPQDTSGIGYYITRTEPNADYLTVPFEWFEKRQTKSNVLVLWLNEDKLSATGPLNQLHTLVNELTPRDLPGGLGHRSVGFPDPAELVHFVPVLK